MEDLFLLNGKNVVVTGGSRGIGKAIALRFAEMGANIAILYAGNDELPTRAESLTEKGIKAHAYRCNVGKHEETEATVQKIIEEFGGIDVLINNAGITKDHLILKMKETDFDDVINVNLKGSFNMIKSVYRIWQSGKVAGSSIFLPCPHCLARQGRQIMSAPKPV